MGKVDDPEEVRAVRVELGAVLEGLNLYQLRLVLSFVRELFGL